MFTLHTKSEQKGIGNKFCTPNKPIIFKNRLKPGFSIRNILLQFMLGVILDCKCYRIFEKQTFNGLLKVIGIKKLLQCFRQKSFSLKLKSG